jgi:uncharacterized alkaline shock family protein YloU
MTDQIMLTEPEGTITVPAATLMRIVVRAAEVVDGAHVRRPRRGVDIEVAGDSARVSLQLAARYGTALPQLAETVQEQVSAALSQMCGLDIRRVDVAIEELVER